MLRVFVNAIVIYLALVFLMRLIGKRQLGELELSELVVTFLISEIASEPILHPDVRLTQIAVPVLTLIGLEYLLSVVSLKNVRLRALFSGKPALLVARGRIDQRQMKKNRITADELTEALRSHGMLDLREVAYAVLETNGQISIIPATECRPVTAGQMGVETTDPGYPIIVINSGRVLSDNLRLLGRDENWLRKQLKENGLSDPGEVYMMTADQAGGVFLARKDGD